MAKANSTAGNGASTIDNEYALMPPEQVVDIAAEMLDRHAEETNQALALAIALRDRLSDSESGGTDAILAGMLVELLCGAPEHSIKLCLFALAQKGGAA